MEDTNYNTLMVAIYVGDIDIVKLLISRGAKLHFGIEYFIQFRNSHYKFSQRVSKFEKYKQTKKRKEEHFSTNHLLTAIKLNRYDIVKFLAETGLYDDRLTSESIDLNAIYYPKSYDIIKLSFDNPLKLYRLDYKLVWKIKDTTSIQHIFDMLIDFHRFDMITEILCHFPLDGDTIYEHFLTETGLLLDIIERKYVFKFDHVRKLACAMTNKKKIPHFSNHYFDIQIIN